MTELDVIKSTFKQNVESVDRLINFDREVQDFTIKNVEELHDKLKHGQLKIDNLQLNGQRTLEILRQIRRNDSLRSQFETIFNQAIVLLVSYFGSSVGDVFRFAISKELEAKRNKRLLREELRTTVEEIADVSQNLGEAVSEIFIAKKDISFQDMQSIRRAFETYVEISMDRDQDVNNIIIGQACRNVIVHRGGVVDGRLINQVKGAIPRTLKLQLSEEDVLRFKPEEVQLLSKSMSKYLECLCGRVALSLPSNNTLEDS